MNEEDLIVFNPSVIATLILSNVCVGILSHHYFDRKLNSKNLLLIISPFC